MTSTLVSRNVTVNGRRTSVRLEPAMWRALEEICVDNGLTIHEFVTDVDTRRRESSLTAAIRVALLMHYRSRATGKESFATDGPRPRRATPGRPPRQAAQAGRAAR